MVSLQDRPFNRYGIEPVEKLRVPNNYRLHKKVGTCKHLLMDMIAPRELSRLWSNCISALSTFNRTCMGSSPRRT